MSEQKVAPTKIPAWQGEWSKRIYERIAPLGYSSVASYLAAHPTLTYSEAAKALGGADGDIAAIQLITLEREEATKLDQFTDFARSSLARELRACIPDGWGVGPKAEFNAAHAYGAWASELGQGYSDISWQLWNALKAQPIPDGWLPEGADDPLIVATFNGVRLSAPEQ